MSKPMALVPRDSRSPFTRKRTVLMMTVCPRAVSSPKRVRAVEVPRTQTRPSDRTSSSSIGSPIATYQSWAWHQYSSTPLTRDCVSAEPARRLEESTWTLAVSTARSANRARRASTSGFLSPEDDPLRPPMPRCWPPPLQSMIALGPKKARASSTRFCTP